MNEVLSGQGGYPSPYSIMQKISDLTAPANPFLTIKAEVLFDGKGSGRWLHHERLLEASGLVEATHEYMENPY